MAPPNLGTGFRRRSSLAHDVLADAIGLTRSVMGPRGTLERSPKQVRGSTSKVRHSENDLAKDVDTAEEMSVALEWKLLFPLLVKGANDPQPDDRRRIIEAQCEDDEGVCLEQAHEYVAKTIKESGEKAVTAHAIAKEGTEEKEYWESSWIVKKANSAEPMDSEKSLKGYVWVSVEICSPRMRIKDPETRGRMQRVLGALTSAYRLTANCSCEVHVHLGRMDGRPWFLSTLKRLGTLLWVTEPTLRSIRDPNSPNFDNVYTWGFAMRQHSRLAKKVGGLGAQSHHEKKSSTGCAIGVQDESIVDLTRRPPALGKELDALGEIWKTTSHVELGQLLSGPEKKYRRLGFNFSAFGEEDERARRSPRTVEFRFMEGSADMNLVLSWLSICCAVVETAVIRSDSRFVPALSESLLLRTGDRHVKAKANESSETEGARRARQFRELMRVLDVPRTESRRFEEKIEREN